jgi:hypothetical protein
MWFVLDAVRKNPLTSKASVAKTEEEIKTWLQGDPGHVSPLQWANQLATPHRA